MKKQSLQLALLVALLVPVAAFTFGGWAVVTVDDLPDYVVAGKPVDLPFTVRQHGVTLLGDLTPTVTLRSGSSESMVRAHASGTKGRYVATVTAPAAGDWSVRIHSGFMNSANTLLPLRAIAEGAQPPRPLADADRGHRLFFAKGCVTCHVRGSEGTDGLKFAPDLTGRKYPPDYLAKFLDDPDKSPLSRQAMPNGRMPKLELKEREIASLVVFINSEGQVSSKP
jgi:mono/diheme cytochrome c family protein